MLTRENLKTDVLVIGGGIAGARAAVEAAGEGVQVTLVTKGVFGSGTSVGPVVCAAAGPWTTPADSRDLHFEGIVVTGRRFLCDQEHARVLADEAPERLTELEEWGHLWDRDPEGNITPYSEFVEEIRMPEESHHYHQNRYVSSVRQGMYFGYTGHNVLQTLRAECRRRGVRVIEEVAGVRLLTRDGAVNGALALDYLHGRWLAIESPSVILATGSIAQLWFPWGLASREMTGDGVAMAYRAGAAIQDLELMMTAYLPSLTPAWSGRHKLLQGVIEAAANYKKEYRIRWINKDNQEFLLRYPPAVPKTYEELYLKVIRGVHTELAEGRGPLCMDYRALPREFLAEVAPFILQCMEKLGRPRQEDWLLEVGPNPMWSFGGIRVSPATEESTVLGLYACADASNAIKDGFGASVACGVTTCLVTGARAGKAAAARAKAVKRQGVDEAQVKGTADQAEVWGARAGGVEPLSAKLEIGGIMRAHMHLKNEAGMMKALNRLQGVRADALPRLAVKGRSPRYCYELVEAFEIENMLDCAEMMVRASLMRRESRRHMFIREDYPHRDDAHWLRHVVIRQGGAGMDLKTVPVDFKYLRPDASGVRPAR